MKKLRLILGDQLNSKHAWYKESPSEVVYLMAEMQQEATYVKHHIQKVVGFFGAMRQFSEALRSKGFEVVYYTLKNNPYQSLTALLEAEISRLEIQKFEYQLPDEYRLDEQLRSFCEGLDIAHEAFDTEHFMTNRNELNEFFSGKKQRIMEFFYRYMRKKHQIMMVGSEPLGGKWNFDHDNRRAYKGEVPIPPAFTFHHEVSDIVDELQEMGIETFGAIKPHAFPWPLNRNESLELLSYFCKELLPYFGTFQDASHTHEKFLFHSRISFALNTKMLDPLEVIDTAFQAYLQKQDEIDLSQIEGFIRQILGWREYVRGIYWAEMPDYGTKNYFEHHNKLPDFFWTGKTDMNCLKHAIGQSLEDAYAHHIQRLMIIGNYALLAGIHPDEVDAWYLGVYIDAIEWVEMPNTRGMSQFADGGLLATKPYVSSGAYINKMTNYCQSCAYKVNEKTGDKACPFNSLYWNFLHQHESKLSNNQRMKMVYSVWNKMSKEQQEQHLIQAEKHLKQ